MLLDLSHHLNQFHYLFRIHMLQKTMTVLRAFNRFNKKIQGTKIILK